MQVWRLHFWARLIFALIPLLLRPIADLIRDVLKRSIAVFGVFFEDLAGDFGPRSRLFRDLL